MNTRVAVAAAAIAFGAVAAPAAAQEARSAPAKVVTKTLVKSEAQKECFSLANAQVLFYNFQADAPLDFKLTHQDEKEVVDLKRDRVDSGAGSYVSKKSSDYCLVWTNAGERSATLHYEYQRGSQ